jgi:pyruvate dehydrogenase E1 component
MEVERRRRLGGSGECWVEQCLRKTSGVTVAASDYVSAVADLIRPYVPGRYVALGTDGFGRSDTRAALRAFFEVDAKSIALAALAALEHPSVARARQVYGVDDALLPPWQR